MPSFRPDQAGPAFAGFITERHLASIETTLQRLAAIFTTANDGGNTRKIGVADFRYSGGSRPSGRAHMAAARARTL